MRDLTRKQPRRIQDRFKDEFRFLRHWAENPLQTGSVTPSGKMLSKAMASYVETERRGPIVELGPGTGVITRALLDRGIDEHRLILVEYSEEFHELLRRRYPRATVIRGDAYALGEVLADVPDGTVASIISGLPLFTQPLPMRQKLFEDARRLMEPGAPFIQLSYALVPAIPKRSPGFIIRHSQWIVANLPPARVWIYRARRFGERAFGPARYAEGGAPA